MSAHASAHEAGHALRLAVHVGEEDREELEWYVAQATGLGC